MLIDVENNLESWDFEKNNNYCSWRGIECDNITQSVISLRLFNFSLGGNISPSIGLLKNLQYLHLYDNQISGQIPYELGNCTRLIELDLSWNALYGDIPNSIGNLRQIESIEMESNQLTGQIPLTLSQLPFLKLLNFNQNRLSGHIPSSIYSNQLLKILTLSQNSLIGDISLDMCQFTTIWDFAVRGNKIGGTIPTNIGNCTSLKFFDVAYNRITGEIPRSIGLLKLAYLTLNGNRLTGKIPEEIGLMQGLFKINLSGNDLFGTIPPSLGNLSRLVRIDLTANQLVGPIPPALGYLSRIRKLYLNGNKLTGPIPQELGNMSSLGYLKLSNNFLVGEIPPQLGNIKRLFGLDLGNNHLVGEIPAELGKLGKLFVLDLSSNYLQGSLPGNLSSCESLTRLNVYGNKLNGSIPIGFMNFKLLSYLNVSTNHFEGRILVEIGRLVNLDTLDISCNNFSGYLPSSIGGLEHLIALNLSKNHIDGPIPAELGKLRSIQILDLSSNNLSGRIPEELGQLQMLNSMNLAENNLSGPIPPELLRFPADRFSGNPLLCGNWSASCLGAYDKQPKGVSRATAILIICSCIGLIILVVFVIILSGRQNPSTKGDNIFEGAPKIICFHNDLVPYSYEDIESLTEKFSDNYIIGTNGSSRKVYKCLKKNCKPIAIKRFDNRNPDNMKEFESELKTIGNIKHRSLVSLLGYSLLPSQNLLFYEYMPNGSLWELLHEPNQVSLDWDARLKIALGAAQGLAYLHDGCSPRVIHRDVKSSNILMDENLEACLTDFGIAKTCGLTAETSTYILGTCGYIDPAYAETGRATEKSDVYSFGIVLFELLTRKEAIDLRDLIMDKTMDNTVMESVDPELSSTGENVAALEQLLQLARLCTNEISSVRPTMHEVIYVLESLICTSEMEESSAVEMVSFHKDMASYSYEDIQSMTEHFSEMYIIGYGASFTIYKCMLNNAKPIIIKRFYVERRNTRGEFETERETVVRIQHPNIMILLGYTLSPIGNLLFYSYMPSLCDLLQKPPNVSSRENEPGKLQTKKTEPENQVKLDWDARLKIALGAATGLAYLHQEKNIIHGDLKSSNILIDDDCEAHLTGFGFAKSLCVSEGHESTSTTGTTGSIDPESFRFSEKSDIYRFGIVLLELLTGKKADDDKGSNFHHLVTDNTMDNKLLETVDPRISSTSTNVAALEQLLQLARSCTNEKSSDQPTILGVIHVLKFIISMTISEVQESPAVEMVPLHKDMASYSYQDIQSVTEHFSETYIIGYGASCTVYKCTLMNSKPIVIKRFYAQRRNTRDEFETERDTIVRIEHPNILSLLGYTLSPVRNLLLYDYMPSLLDFLQEKSEPGVGNQVKLTWDARLRIARGVAQSLAYLHHTQNIIHGDIKSSNIFIDDDFKAHLTGFGLAKSLRVDSKAHSSTSTTGITGSIDPESFRLAEKSDMYSYGIVLFELLTGKKAVNNGSNFHHLITSEAVLDAVMAMETIDPEICKTCDLAAVKRLFQLAQHCTTEQPYERPMMHGVIRALESLVPIADTNSFRLLNMIHLSHSP